MWVRRPSIRLLPSAAILIPLMRSPALLRFLIAYEPASLLTCVCVAISCVEVLSVNFLGGLSPRMRETFPIATVPFFSSQNSRGKSLELVVVLLTVMVPVITCVPVFEKVTRSEAITLLSFHNSIPRGASGNTSTHASIR